MENGLFARTIIRTFAWVSVGVPLVANAQEIQTTLDGYREVPTLSSPATGSLSLALNDTATEIEYVLSYSGFTTPVQQAHLHLGREGVNGGIIIFLCSNLPNPPANVPACPQTEGEVTGTLTPEGVIGPAEQGIAAGEFAELIEAIRNDAVYANVHSEQYPPGEIRGQLRLDEGTDDEGDDTPAE